MEAESSASDDVLEALANPPDLDFSNQPEPLEFDFPQISKNRDQKLEEDGVYLRSELSRFFRNASRKFKYRDFFDSKRYLSLTWAGDEVLKEDGRFVLRTGSQRAKNAINENPSSASAWFRDSVVDTIAAAEEYGPQCRFLIGDPGSGKSTFLKYLINRERRYCKHKSVVFCRFEASKFLIYARDRMGKIAPALKRKEAVHMQRIYIDPFRNVLMLRDLLVNYCLSISANGEITPDLSLVGGYDGMESIVRVSLPKRFNDEAGDIVRDFRRRFRVTAQRRKLQPRDTRFEFLLLYDDEIVRSLLAGFVIHIEDRIGTTINFGVIYDGLDLISPEDYNIDAPRYALLQQVLQMYDLLDPAAYNVTSINFNTLGRSTISPNQSAIIALRYNTIDAIVTVLDKDIDKERNVVWNELPRLSPDAVIYRSIRRSLARPVSAISTPDPFFQNLYTSTMGLLEYFADVGIPKSDDVEPVDGLKGFHLFSGNIRDYMDLTVRLLLLLKEEAHLADRLSPSPTLEELIEFVNSSAGQSVRRRRGYRFIESVLFSRQGYFRNAMRWSPPEETEADDWSLRKNHLHDGLIDNIFIYHYFP